MTAVATATGQSLAGDARVPAEPAAGDRDGGDSHAAASAPFPPPLSRSLVGGGRGFLLIRPFLTHPHDDSTQLPDQ